MQPLRFCRGSKCDRRTKQLQAMPAPAPQPPVAEQPQTQPPPAQTEQQQTSPVKVDPALERRAQAYLNDTADVSTMKRKQLRKRLAEVRDLLASNRLTPATRDALRAKLARERAVLRDDVATSEGLPPPDQPPPQGQKPGQQQGGNGNDADQRKVLQDRRPPRELDDHELVLSDGSWTECFQPGVAILRGTGHAQRAELVELFPELHARHGIDSATAARRSLERYEARVSAE